MRRFIAFVFVVGVCLPTLIHAETIGDAYAREYTFLKAQKSELEGRIANEASLRLRAERRSESELERLQAEFLALSDQLAVKQTELAKHQDTLEEVSDNSDVVGGVLQQMDSTLANYELSPDEQANVISTREKLTFGFVNAADLFRKLSSRHSESGSFFLQDGVKVDGEIVHLGNVAAYGISDRGAGVLVPAGGGRLRLWQVADADEVGRLLAAGDTPESLPLFVFENRDAEISPPETKTLTDVLHSGGLIGYIILGLGAVGLLLVVLRFLRLLFSGGGRRGMIRKIVRFFGQRDLEGAQAYARKKGGAAGRMARDIVQNIQFDRERLDDIISESIIRESTRLDRWGALILVIAAISPLLGLLGTVSGMISTFDSITEFGTGDPKLLAGGISVALVTTMLGLIVAIPLLLFGNLLGGWAQRIKDSLEKNALHIVNEYERTLARS